MSRVDRSSARFVCVPTIVLLWCCALCRVLVAWQRPPGQQSLLNHCKSIIWWFSVHAVPAKQGGPKLSHYYSNTYSRIVDANSSVGGMFISNAGFDCQATYSQVWKFLPTQLLLEFPISHRAFLQHPQKDMLHDISLY